MYWIQEMGQKTGSNRADWKMFHCDYATDVAKLPTNTTLGTQSTGDLTFDNVTNAYAVYGDQCLCLENSKVYELRWIPNDWKEL